MADYYFLLKIVLILTSAGMALVFLLVMAADATIARIRANRSAKKRQKKQLRRN